MIQNKLMKHNSLMWLTRTVSSGSFIKTGFRVGTMSGMLLLMINVIYMITGTVMIIFGIQGLRMQPNVSFYAKMNLNEDKNMKSSFKYKVYVMLGMSMIISVGSSLMGLKFNYSRLLCVRGVLVCIMFHVKVIITAQIHVPDLELHHHRALLFEEYQKSSYDSERHMWTLSSRWRTIQMVTRCCGYNNSLDYQTFTGVELLPGSCCQGFINECYANSSSGLYKVFQRGCSDKLKDLTIATQENIAYASMIVLITETICVMTGITVLLKEVTQGTKVKV